MKVGDIIEHAKACRWCGCTGFLVEPGKGPHAFHLRCTGCERGGVWLPAGAQAQVIDHELGEEFFAQAKLKSPTEDKS